jgi:hypothetical protein
MPTLKRLLAFILSGAFLGNIVGTLVGPGMLVWYNTAADDSAMCNCLTTVKEAASSLIRVQLIGTAVGAVLFLALGIFLRPRSAPVPAPPSGPVSPPPS